MNYFEELYNVDIEKYVEERNGLRYISWSYAWREVKRLHPDASYTIYESENGCIYHTDGKTCWVKTGVTIEGIEYIEYLPIMDSYNRSIPLSDVTSVDANMSIQRSITKAIARHGLGLCLYCNNDDLPAQKDMSHSTVEEKATSSPNSSTGMGSIPSRRFRQKPATSNN